MTRGIIYDHEDFAYYGLVGLASVDSYEPIGDDFIILRRIAAPPTVEQLTRALKDPLDLKRVIR